MLDSAYEFGLEDFQNLETGLRAAISEMQEDCRGGTITALQVVVHFINLVPRLESQSLALPFVNLMAALNDLNLGRTVPLLAHATGFNNRKPDASLRKVQRALAVHFIDCLFKAGMALIEASKFMVAQFKIAGVPIGGQQETLEWKTVMNWRYDATRRKRDDDQERHALAALRVEFDFTGQPLETVKAIIQESLPCVLRQYQLALG